MKRLYAAIAFLLIILATSAFTIFQCRQFRDQAIPQVEQIIEYAETGHLEQAAGLSGQFFDSWSKTRDSMVWYIRHEPLEKITGIASRLESLAHHDDLSQLIAQANELIVHIDELYHNELPLIQNLI